MNKEYDMNHENRGFAIVINNKHFPGDEVRHGSEKDVESIKQALKSLEFNVQVYEDCTAFKMIDLMNLYGSMDHEENDCSVCVIMSHGSEDTIQGVDGKSCKIDELTKSFKANPSLKGKPKIFFIQACRGSVKMDSRPAAAHQTDSCVQTDSRPGTTRKLPKEADVLIQYSTVLGYVSFRDPSSGSWYIQSLASTLLEKGQLESLHQLTTEVHRKVVDYCNQSHVDSKQCANINHTLLKDVYFRPKKKLVNNTSTKTENVFYLADGRYEGDCINGKGTCFFKSGNKYTGDWSNGKRSGKGVFYFANGNRYEGDFLNNNFHGKGTLYYNNGNKYTGDWNNSKMTGKGVFYYANGDRYEGDNLDGKSHGKGTYYWSSGSKYTGDWNNNKRTGKCVYYYANGDRYEGDFLDEKRTGKGVYYHANGDRDEGNFFENEFLG